jgi:putative endonuclease
MAARWTIYLLRCADGSLYTGITNDLPARLAAHQAGRASKFTRSRRPVALAWKKAQQDPTAARRLEWALRRSSRADKLRLAAGNELIWRRLRRGLG